MSARAAAQTSVYCAVAKELDGVSGRYFRRCCDSRVSSLASDPQLAAQLWHVCVVTAYVTSTLNFLYTVNPSHRRSDRESVYIGPSQNQAK